VASHLLYQLVRGISLQIKQKEIVMITRSDSSTSSLSPFFRLFSLFETFIHTWGAGSVEELDILGKSTDFSIERMVQLTGTLEGLLVLRASPAFVVWLRNKRGFLTGDFKGDEIFNEMVSFYCLHLFHDFWKPDNFKIGPIKPRFSTPEDWPSKKFDHACCLLVEGHPVEIRLWLK
jgi:hypothetical protein